MSTRYVRKEVPLEVRGISRASVEHHPLPERVEGGGATPTLPFTYVQSVHNAMQSFDPSVKRRRRGRLFATLQGPTRSESPTNSSTTPSATSSSTYGPGQPDEAMLGALSALSPDGSAGGTADWLVRVEGGMGGGGGLGGGGGKGWTTENTTDRTSLSSSDWGDDVCEFDRQESRRVRIMFEQIEAMLFELSSTGPAHLYRECRHWVDRFPHLRLLGAQLVTPQDHGFSYYPMPVPNPDDDSPRTITDLSTTPDHDTMSLLGRRLKPNSPPSNGRTSEPEDSAEEAEEEVFAMEGVYEDMIAVDHRITEEDVTEKKYMKRRRHHGYPPLTPNAVLKDSIVNAVFDTQWAEIVSWMRPLLTENIARMQGQPKEVDILPVLPLTPNQEGNFPSARTDIPPRLSRPSPSTPVDEGTLASLLHISIKTLQTRERSSLHDIPESPPVVPHGRRPSSSLPRRPPSSTRLPSARTRGRGRLVPLDRSRTPFHEEESLLRSGLRGRSLQTGGEQLIRSGTLPPLSMSAMATHQHAPAARSQGLGRIGSAVGGPGRVSALAQNLRSPIQSPTTGPQQHTPSGRTRRSGAAAPLRSDFGLGSSSTSTSGAAVSAAPVSQRAQRKFNIKASTKSTSISIRVPQIGAPTLPHHTQ